ncbi:hypothetical protein [Psychromonas sp.]|uniref:hypothetical protein n=1 Tax=Psychromonas sp. TaxID=1884585 RepID=UPI0035699103
MIEKLKHVEGTGGNVFVKIPTSMTIDTVNMHPHSMFCTLFPVLGNTGHDAGKELLEKLKEKSSVSQVL